MPPANEKCTIMCHCAKACVSLLAFPYLASYWNVEKRLIGTEASIQSRKSDEFWLLWGTFNEYTKQNFVMAVF